MSSQAPPLSHHEILTLVEPFTRRGHRVDLPGSDRSARRLRFRAVEHVAAPDLPALHEQMELDSPGAGSFRLTRLLTGPGGLQARLQAQGPAPGALLECIEAVPPARQWQLGDGHAVALSHRLESTPGSSGRDGAGTRLVLTEGTALLDGLSLRMKVSPVRGIPAELELAAADDPVPDWPDDLLAVLGWHWGRLLRVREGWRCSVGLRGAEPVRSADAEARLLQGARHLARTLAEPPARFHERQIAARWGVVARRLGWLLATGAMLGGAAAVSQLQLVDNSIFRMLIFHSPPLLLMAFFCLREMPRIEFPPLPRRPRLPSWRPAQAGVPVAPGAG